MVGVRGAGSPQFRGAYRTVTSAARASKHPEYNLGMLRLISGDVWETLYPRDDADDDLPPLVRRKLVVLVDEDLSGTVLQWLESNRRFRVLRLPAGTPDDVVWHEAQRQRAVIISGNARDFWSEQRFHIQQCPGLLVLVGSTDTERLRALRRAVATSALLEDNARWGTCRDMKIKAAPAGDLVVRRYYANEAAIRIDPF